MKKHSLFFKYQENIFDPLKRRIVISFLYFSLILKNLLCKLKDITTLLMLITPVIKNVYP